MSLSATLDIERRFCVCSWYKVFSAAAAQISQRCKTDDCVTIISKALNPVFYLYNNNKPHQVYLLLQLIPVEGHNHKFARVENLRGT